MRRLSLSVAVLGVVLALLLAALHTPVVRRAVLRTAVSVARDRFGVRIEAASLDYNLLALRVSMRGLRVSALDHPDEPFLRADRLDVEVPWRALAGILRFDRVALTGGRIAIVYDEAGRSNLPVSDGSGGGAPPSLDIGTLEAPGLAVEYRHPTRGLFVSLPGVDLRLAGADGRLALTMPAQLTIEPRSLRLTRLDGRLAFDGRRLGLSDVRLEGDGLTADLDGELGVLEAEPDVVLTVSLDAVLELLPNLLRLDPAPSGTVAAQGQVSGPLGAPVVTLAVRSPRLEWHGVTLADVEASTTVTTASLGMERMSFTLAGGRVDGSATIPFDATATTTVSAQIAGLDVAEAVRLAAPGAAVTPSATVSGTLEASGRVPDPAGWSASLDLTARSRGNGPARVGVGGTVALTLAGGRWRVRGDTIVADVAPVALVLDGTLEPPDAPAGNAGTGAAAAFAPGTAAGIPAGAVTGTVSGTVTVGESTLDAWSSAARDLGYTVPDAVANAMGLVQGEVRLSGSLSDPAVDAAVQATDVTGSSLRVPLAEITATGRPVRRALVFDTRVPEADVAGQSIRQLSARASWEGNQLLIDDLSAGQASGPGALRASAVFDLASSTVTGTASLTGWMVTPTPELPASAVVEGTFTAQGPLDEPTGSGTLVLSDARWDDVVIGRLDVGLTLDGEGPHADVRAGSLDLAAVTAGLDLPVSLAGSAAARVAADIAPADWRASRARLVIEQLDALVGRLPLRLEGTATAVYDNGALHVDPLTVRADGVTIEASGDVQAFAVRQPDTAAPGLQAVVRGTVDDVLAAVAASGVSTVAPLGGTGSLTLAAVVTGALDAPRLAVDLDAGPAVINLEGLPPLSEVVVRARLRDGWAEVDRLEAAFEGARVAVAGRVPAAWILDRTAPVTAADGAASLEGRATRVSPQVLVPFVGEGILDGVEGGLDLALSLTSASPALQDLRGELRVERLDLAVADLPIRQVVPTRIVAEDGFARVADWQWTGEGLTLGLQGQVRLEDRQAAVLANGVVDLRLLSPFVRDSGVATAGRLETRLSVTGVLDAPRIDGDLRVSNGVVALADPRVQVSDLEVRALVSRSGAQITSLTGSLNGGTLTGGGTAMLSDAGTVRADLTLTVREAALEVPDGLRSEVDADLAFSLVREPGDVRPEGRLSGDVTIRRSAYREQVTLITGLFAGLGRPTLPSPTDGPTLADRIALNVRVVTDEDLIVNNNYGRFELGADVRVIGTAAQPALAGRAVLREGGQVFFGRNAFVVDRGTVDFSNPTAIEPSLDLEARTDVAGEQIVLTLTGTPAELESNLRSTTTPELGPSDLTSLLLTGRRLEDVPGDEAAIVSEQVLGFLSGDVLGLAGNAVGLDVLRIGGPGSAALRRDPVALATETDPSTRVTFGKSIGERLDVTVSQSLRQSAAQTWIIDYLATRRLVLRLVSDDDNLRSYELRHDVSFGGTPLLADRPREAVRRSPDVAQVRVIGADEGEADLRRRLRLRAGDRFDFIRWQDDRDRLERALQDDGFLEADVRAARTTEGEDVVLTYTVARGPRTRIEVTGADLPSGTLGRLERAWGEEVFDGFLVEQAESITRDALVVRGFLDARVEARVVEDGTDKVLALAVEPGTRWTDTRVVVTGVDLALQDDIRTWLRSREDTRAIWITPAVVADEVMGFLRGLGYVRAEVEIGSPMFGDGVAVATIEVMPGPLFAVAEVEIRGTARLGLDEAEAAVDLRPDDPYAPDRVAAARDRLIARYRLRGFPEVQVSVDQRLDEAASGVGLVFDVEEGPQQVIGEVVIEGTRTIAAEDVRRALALEPDEPAGTETLLAARRRVYETGLFRRVDLIPEPIELPGAGSDGGPGEAPDADPDAAPDAAVQPVRARLTVQEWPAFRLRYGFQVSEERPETEVEGRDLTPGLSADITRRTLFGRPIGLGGAVEYERRQRSARLFLNAPTLFGQAVESSLTLEASRREFSAATLITDRRGGAWEQRVRFDRPLRLSYSYRLERNRTFDTAPPLDPTFPPFDITLTASRLNGAAVWDSRDDPSDTTRGLLVSSSVEWAADALGSDIHFLKYLGQAYVFARRGGVVFASAARLGLATTPGDEELITSERFFAGGARTVRGAPEEGLGPTNFLGEPSGGAGLLVLNQELRVPLYRWVRGVLFVDAGNVFAGVGDLRPTRLSGSTGVGLRVHTPFAIFRVDWGRLWSPDSSGGRGRWTFGIGQTF